MTTTVTPAQGTVAYNPNTGILTYTPNAQNLNTNQSRLDTFTYTVTDPQGAAVTRQISVTVTGANDVNTFTVGDSPDEVAV